MAEDSKENPETKPAPATDGQAEQAPDGFTDQESVVEDLVKSRKYMVHIKERSTISAGRVLQYCIVIVGIAIVTAVALLYTGIVNSPIDLPFMNEEPSTIVSAPTDSESTSTPSPDVTIDDTTSVNTELYSMQIPQDWVKERTIDEVGGERYFTDTYTLPSGTTLTVAQDFGGRGGACEPAEGDEPHASGNACPTLELIEKSELERDETATQPIYVTQEWFTNTEGISTFSLCLRTYDEAFNPEPEEPYMGFVLEGCGPGVAVENTAPIVVNITGIDASTDAYFSNADIVAIQDVLRTFRLL
jgi:hypothetical protein